MSKILLLEVMAERTKDSSILGHSGPSYSSTTVHVVLTVLSALTVPYLL
jgi:hypothetical protein